MGGVFRLPISAPHHRHPRHSSAAQHSPRLHSPPGSELERWAPTSPRPPCLFHGVRSDEGSCRAHPDWEAYPNAPRVWRCSRDVQAADPPVPPNKSSHIPTPLLPSPPGPVSSCWPAACPLQLALCSSPLSTTGQDTPLPSTRVLFLHPVSVVPRSLPATPPRHD